ncbi:MAG: co-chaperone GroES [Chlamydiota bacterium]
MTKQAEAKRVSLKPVGSRVIAKRLEPEDTLQGGIILPDSAKKKQEVLEVIRVGQPQVVDGKEIPIPVTPGDHILVDKYSGQEFDEEFVIVDLKDIVAIVE